MTRLEAIFKANLDLLAQAGITFNQWRHEPILDFATDEKIAKQLDWIGTHSKSLFLKLKNGDFVLYLTEKDKRLDSKQLKALLGKRPSICSDEEMIEQLGCVPGAVCPFGLPPHIIMVVDHTLFKHQELLYTPGDPEYTFGITGQDLDRLLSLLPNTIHTL
ncbi:YbaK/EbsC family protein [Vibrio aestuarianus]|uniref:YbaK/EbsC family protein n=1 Tax=Vibrio aestuarianus TaxID=28171 RepID=A0ABD7YKQ9_9VIBR|nr:YbaK/EbsC family protein [Vibrio aestuarianus]WGK85643.1 YbaK/EbsC family protein [Vibrio aestuarianus]CAH8210021.1 putative DNA-binding protein [Vibrio aestuarianus]